jgi:ferredoxin
MDAFFHSVRLDKDKCKGCTNCIKRCPTQAIRVRSGKAHIIKERCIDCGECVRVCPHHAKYVSRDSLSEIVKYKYRIALPAPALYAQFNNLEDATPILRAIPLLGFDAVFEVAAAAELISEATRRLMKENKLITYIMSLTPEQVDKLVSSLPLLISLLLAEGQSCPPELSLQIQ